MMNFKLGEEDFITTKRITLNGMPVEYKYMSGDGDSTTLACNMNNYDFYKRYILGGWATDEREKEKLPKRYIINKGATILFWDEDEEEKTIVKRSKDDKFNKRLGFLTAYFQYHSGLSKTKANKFLDSLEVEKEKEKQETKRPAILDEIDTNLEKAKKEVDKIIFGK